MNKLARLSLPLIGIALSASARESASLTSFVDPLIGSGDHGHVFVGANVPFGMVNAGPTQLETGWDWCSGYHYDGTRIVGFAQTHLSGTGCSDLGDIAIMPSTRPLTLTREGLATPFSHTDEEAHPGYYSILLPTTPVQHGQSAARVPHIRTEITADLRNAMYRITYPKDALQNRLVIDLENGIGDRVRYSRLTDINDSTFTGFRISHGWADEQHCYFAIRFSRPVAELETSPDGGNYYQLLFTPSTEPLIVTISLSPVSEINAMCNMVSPSMTFDEMRREADEIWNRNLGRIQATFLNQRDCRIFYTAMYHFMVAPQIWDDQNGDWRGADNRTYRLHSGVGPQDDGRDGFAWPFGVSAPSYLTTLSLWDTYRAASPLSTILLPEMMPSVAETYLRIFREQGKLPVWHLMSQETNCMVGCPAVPILADLFLKGYVRDTTAVWNAIKHSLLTDERGLDDMNAFGYVCSDHHSGSLSMSLEYMLAFWAAAKVGKAILTTHPYDESIAKTTAYFTQRAHGYDKLFDPRVGFLRSRDSSDRFGPVKDFNPAHQTSEYTEGNPWQYLWLVPHDIEGLSHLLGGREKALCILDQLFEADSQLNAEANPDITGLIGQYAHGNEPSHHIAYLYTLLGQPRRTQTIVRQIMRDLYTDQPAGLCGNEDVGQMSAWYLLSALGFYPVEPCGGQYVLGSPIVKDATLKVGTGKSFVIRTHGNSRQAVYVSKVLLNGTPLSNGILRHEDIMAGGTLDFYMEK